MKEIFYFYLNSNQESLENLKKLISEKQSKQNEFFQAANRSKAVLNSIKLTIIDLIQKLHEIEIGPASIEVEANENTSSGALLQVMKLRNLIYSLEE